MQYTAHTHTHSRLNFVESFGPARAYSNNWSEWDHLVLFGHGMIMNNQCFHCPGCVNLPLLHPDQTVQDGVLEEVRFPKEVVEEAQQARLS